MYAADTISKSFVVFLTRKKTLNYKLYSERAQFLTAHVSQRTRRIDDCASGSTGMSCHVSKT